MMIALMTILKKLADIYRRILTDDQYHSFRRSAVVPVCTTGHTATDGWKIRTRELGNNGCSVLGIPNLEWEKPPPFARAAP